MYFTTYGNLAGGRTWLPTVPPAGRRLASGLAAHTAPHHPRNAAVWLGRVSRQEPGAAMAAPGGERGGSAALPRPRGTGGGPRLPAALGGAGAGRGRT